MNFLFLTLQYDSKKEKEYFKKSKVALQAAANTFQNNLLLGFKEADAKCEIMNTIPIATFPKYRQVWFNNNTGNLCGYPNVEIGFLNIPILKQTTRIINYWNQINKWIKNTSGEKCIIAYSLYLPFEIVFRKIKKKYPDIKLGLICPDLPCEFGILSPNKIKAKLQINYGRKTLSYSNYADFFILFTEQMKEPLNVGKRPYIVVEGICNSNYYQSASLNAKDKTILYTGTLNEKMGIGNLLEAFSMIKSSDYRLWICGDGNMRNEVVKAAKEDSRIKFYGFVDKETVLNLQQEATILVNPRQNDDTFTKYSFPSKTMEYMLSGKPVIMYKLDGIPDEYDDYLNYVKGDTIEDLKTTIINICEKSEDELLDIGQKARDFVLTYKSGRVQAKKIIDFLNII